MLVDEGTSIVKVFLNVSKDEQAERLQERIDDPAKRWKYRPGDLEVSKRYDEYMAGYGGHRDVDGVGAMARGPRRPQLGQVVRDRGDSLRRPGATRSEAPGGAPGRRGLSPGANGHPRYAHKAADAGTGRRQAVSVSQARRPL